MAIEARQPTIRRKWRRSRRLLIAAVPGVVWLLAIGGAFQLHRRAATVGNINGFGEDQPVTLTHLEAGVVREVYVELYDPVVLGQVVVTMDDREERILLSAVEKDIERLSADVGAQEARLTAGNAQAAADVADLARRFAIDRETTRIDYLAQLAQDARDRIMLRGATIELDIVRGLHDRRNATFRELNAIQTEVDALKAAIAANAEVLDRKQKAFQDADQRWARFIEHGDVATAYEPVLTPLRLAIDVRERELEDIVRRIDAHVLRATVDGQVTDLMAHAGDRIQPGTPLVTISPTSTSRVVAYLPERMTLSATPGTPVSVECLASADGQRRLYSGTIARLAATVTEAPLRYRRIPNHPVWGRGTIITLNDDVRIMPGEAVSVALQPATPLVGE